MNCPEPEGRNNHTDLPLRPPWIQHEGVGSAWKRSRQKGEPAQSSLSPFQEALNTCLPTLKQLGLISQSGLKHINGWGCRASGSRNHRRPRSTTNRNGRKRGFHSALSWSRRLTMLGVEARDGRGAKTCQRAERTPWVVAVASTMTVLQTTTASEGSSVDRRAVPRG